MAAAVTAVGIRQWVGHTIGAARRGCGSWLVGSGRQGRDPALRAAVQAGLLRRLCGLVWVRRGFGSRLLVLVLAPLFLLVDIQDGGRHAARKGLLLLSLGGRRSLIGLNSSRRLPHGRRVPGRRGAEQLLLKHLRLRLLRLLMLFCIVAGVVTGAAEVKHGGQGLRRGGGVVVRGGRRHEASLGLGRHASCRVRGRGCGDISKSVGARHVGRACVVVLVVLGLKVSLLLLLAAGQAEHGAVRHVLDHDGLVLQRK